MNTNQLRLTRGERERMEELSAAIWSQVFHALDCEIEFTGDDAGEVAQAVVDTFRTAYTAKVGGA